MTQEEKSLLLKDLSERLPYGVKISTRVKGNSNFRDSELSGELLDNFIKKDWGIIKPYLRSLSSMTGEEYETFPIPYSFDSLSTWNSTILSEVIEGTQILIGIDEITEIIDWFKSHHFDYRGLIEKGLALEAPEGMYKF